MTSGPTIHELALSDIVMDESLQVRRKLHHPAVVNYLNVYKAGGEMPPIRVARVDAGALVLVDGWHRVAALTSLGRGRVNAEIIETTQQGARWEAARANLAHGVPLRTSEFRNVFRAYVKARQHYKRRGALKSYRDIALELGGTRSYSTIRNWMLADFPKIAKKMGGTEGRGEGGLYPTTQIDPEDDLLDAGIRGAASAAAAARGMSDPERRGRLVEELTKALKIATEAGPYELPKDDFGADDF